MRGPVNGHYEDCAYIRSLAYIGDPEEECDCADRESWWPDVDEEYDRTFWDEEAQLWA